MKLHGFAWIAVALGSVGGVGLLALPSEKIRTLSDDSNPGVLAFRVGDEFTFRFLGPGSYLLQVRVAEPRLVAGPDFKFYPVIPLIMKLPDGENVYLTEALKVESGGAMLQVPGCFFDPSLPCNSRNNIVGLFWNGCLLNGIFSTASFLHSSDLEKPTWKVRDAWTNRTWEFGVKRVGEDRYRLELSPSTPPDRYCVLPTIIDLDTRERRVVGFEFEGKFMSLESFRKGEGKVWTFGSSPPTKGSFVPVDSPRIGPYPPGGEFVGWNDWNVGQAWAYASENDPDFRRFLQENPETYIYNVSFSGGESSNLGDLIQSSSKSLKFRVLSLQRKMVEVTVSLNTIQGIPSKTSTTRPIPLPSTIPEHFLPPLNTMANLQSFVKAIRSKGLEPIPEEIEAHGDFLALPREGEPLPYFYYLTLGGKTVSSVGFSGWISTSYVALNAQSGELGHIFLPLEQARKLLLGDPLT